MGLFLEAQEIAVNYKLLMFSLFWGCSTGNETIDLSASHYMCSLVNNCTVIL